MARVYIHELPCLSEQVSCSSLACTVGDVGANLGRDPRPARAPRALPQRDGLEVTRSAALTVSLIDRSPLGVRWRHGGFRCRGEDRMVG